jgi:hypothetical protein
MGIKRAQQKPKGQEEYPLVVCLLISTNIKREKGGLVCVCEESPAFT